MQLAVGSRARRVRRMSTSTPSEIVRAFWAAFDARRFDDVFRDLIAPECELVMPGVPAMKGPAAIRQMFEAYVRAFPDFTCSPIHGIEQGDTFAGEARYTGTHRQPLATARGEIPATGNAVAWSSADIVRTSG